MNTTQCPCVLVYYVGVGCCCPAGAIVCQCARGHVHMPPLPLAFGLSQVLPLPSACQAAPGWRRPGPGPGPRGSPWPLPPRRRIARAGFRLPRSRQQPYRGTFNNRPGAAATEVRSGQVRSQRSGQVRSLGPDLTCPRACQCAHWCQCSRPPGRRLAGCRRSTGELEAQC